MVIKIIMKTSHYFLCNLSSYHEIYLFNHIMAKLILYSLMMSFLIPSFHNVYHQTLLTLYVMYTLLTHFLALLFILFFFTMH